MAGRYAIFGRNLALIKRHNEEALAGKHSYEVALNEFADLTWEEFSASRLGYTPASPKRQALSRPLPRETENCSLSPKHAAYVGKHEHTDNTKLAGKMWPNINITKAARHFNLRPCLRVIICLRATVIRCLAARRTFGAGRTLGGSTTA